MTNGDFEAWADGQPTGWKSASTASNASLSQSTDAHGGKYSVKVAGDEGSNKRLASQEITLPAGTYTFSFYAKATTADAAQVRPGNVPVAEGKVGSYAYGDYANINNNGWTQVTYEFTLNAETVVCLVVMNPKKSSYSAGKDVLIVAHGALNSCMLTQAKGLPRKDFWSHGIVQCKLMPLFED